MKYFKKWCDRDGEGLDLGAGGGRPAINQRGQIDLRGFECTSTLIGQGVCYLFRSKITPTDPRPISVHPKVTYSDDLDMSQGVAAVICRERVRWKGM